MSPHPSGKKKQGRGSQPEPERRKRRQQISKTRGGGKDAEKLLRRGEETFEEFGEKEEEMDPLSSPSSFSHSSLPPKPTSAADPPEKFGAGGKGKGGGSSFAGFCGKRKRFSCRNYNPCSPERVQYHGEQDELAQERDDERSRRDDLGEKQEEHSQRQEDADGQAHLR